MLLPILPTLLDAGTMGARPIFEKFAVSKINRVQFTFIRYIFSGVISFIIINILDCFRAKDVLSFYLINATHKSQYYINSERK